MTQSHVRAGTAFRLEHLSICDIILSGMISFHLGQHSVWAITAGTMSQTECHVVYNIIPSATLMFPFEGELVVLTCTLLYCSECYCQPFQDGQT